jgi:hypothetical protein
MQPGDRVRVRTLEEIIATLDDDNRLKGCLFMAEMGNYCETEQQVLKPVERLLDESEYRVRRTTGIVLLDGVICQGTEYPQGCDHACFFFWRKEWLEKIRIHEIDELP